VDLAIPFARFNFEFFKYKKCFQKFGTMLPGNGLTLTRLQITLYISVPIRDKVSLCRVYQQILEMRLNQFLW